MGKIICKCCGASVEAIGPKPRWFCNKPKCRKRASRERIAEEKRREREKQQVELRLRWRRLHPRAVEDLESLLVKYGIEAATLATNAVELQYELLKRR